jgi:hypothetical protein
MSLKALQKDQTEIFDQIETLKGICKELKGNDNETVTTQLLKKAATGQHGIKDNGKVTRGQLREGLEERIDQLKRDLLKVNKKIADLL